MPSRPVTAVLVGIAAVSLAIGLYAIFDEPSSNTVEYYDGAVLLDCSEVPDGSRIDVSAYDGGHRIRSHTFFGWNTSPDGTGTTYHPGSVMNADEDVRLYAMVTDGNMSVNGGVADFSMSDIPDDGRPMFIDAGCAGYVGELRISSDTFSDVASLGKLLTVDFGEKRTVSLDSVAVSQCVPMIGSGSSPVVMTIGGDADSFEFVLIVGGVRLDRLPEGTMAADIGYERSCADSVVKVLENGTGDTGAVFSNGVISFRSQNMVGFDIAELMPLRISRSDGSEVDLSDPDLELVADKSDSYGRWGMFSEGDSFTLSSKSGTMHFRISGVSVSDDGVYTVTGRSAVTVSVEEGPAVYKIVLPKEQIGYTITSDVSSVEEGGRCILTYSLTGGYEDGDLVITVNGLVVEPDSMKRIYIPNIKCDKIVEVKGVYDLRTYAIVLPEDQTGYILCASDVQVHHNQSYAVTFELIPGYTKGPDFKVLLNGTSELDVSSGEVSVGDVQADQVLSVSGVSEAEYSIVAGTHTVLKVNGTAVSTATVNDVISVEAEIGYKIPATYPDSIGGNISVTDGGYRVTGDAVFPSVVRLTVGDNVLVDGHPEGTDVFVCTTDLVSISVEEGYTLPHNFEHILTQNGSIENGKYIFNKDAKIPSIYSVTYYGFSDIYKTFFVVSGDSIPSPVVNPSERAYVFEGWNNSETIIKSDLSVRSIWTPCTFNVYFGSNLKVTINEIVYTFGLNEECPPRSIPVKSNEIIKISTTLGEDLPSGYGPNNQNGILCMDNSFKVVGECSFPGVSCISYRDSHSANGSEELTIIGQSYHLISNPTWEIEGFEFSGWKLDNEYVYWINVEKGSYIFVAHWRPSGVG